MDEKRSFVLPVVLVAVAVATAAGGWWWWSSQRGTAPPVARVETPAPAPVVPQEPAVAHPLPGESPQSAMQAPAQAPADALEAFRRDLAGLGDAAALARWIDPETLVRRVVSTVDNLAGDTLPLDSRVVKPMPGAFAVTAAGDGFLMDAANSRRYEPFVRWLESVDTKRAVDVYVRHYRLFQGEYRGQGSPGRYFNDRAVAAIDHLLAAPEPIGPVRLVQPKVLYRYAEPSLEALSAGQKAMVRMGPENAARVKARLRALRAEIARQAPATR